MSQNYDIRKSGRILIFTFNKIVTDRCLYMEDLCEKNIILYFLIEMDGMDFCLCFCVFFMLISESA